MEVTMKKISGYILKYWYAYAFAIFCMIASIALDMLAPQITKRIIDDVIGEGNLSILTGLLLTILFIGIGRCVFGYFKELIFDCVSTKISVHIRRNLFHHIQTLSVSYFDRTNTGELMSRVKDDVDRIWNGIGYVGMLVIEVVIHTSIVLWCMYHTSPQLFIIPVIAMPLVGFFAIVMENKLNKVYEDISEETAELNTVAQENLAGVRTVKAFAREKFEIGKFLSHNKRYYDLNMQQSRLLIKYQPLFQFITKLLPIVVIIYGGFLVIEEQITLGTLSAFAEYCTNIVWPMEMLGWLSNDFASAIASNRKIQKIYDVKPEITERPNPVILKEVRGSVEFDHVSLTLSDKEILKDISFTLPAGKTLGIMGATGTGKTSIVNLLQRFYDVTEGRILLDGTDIRDLTLKQLRRSMAPVMQDVFLFSDTIHENVSLGSRGSIPKTEIADALAGAQARDFIEQMEDRYDTIIGERGVGLSGGQKQRISIARAFAKHAPILVMDDSTSALDMETEHQIQETLTGMTNITKIIIAHRISAVRHADEIIILKDGQIAERGTHESLLAGKGMYYETYLAQYGDYLSQPESYTLSAASAEL